MPQQLISRSNPPISVKYIQGTWSLLFRPVDVLDIPVIDKQINESLPHLRRFMYWTHAKSSPYETRAMFLKWRQEYFLGKRFNFGIFDIKSQEFLGLMGLLLEHELNPNCFEFSYWIGSKYVRHGIGTLALRILSLIAFRRLDMDRLQAVCNVENEASIRLLEKCGFKREGEMKNLMPKPTGEMIKNGYVAGRDGYMYALLKEEMKNLVWPAEMASSIELRSFEGKPIFL